MFYIYIGEMVTFLDIGEIALYIDEMVLYFCIG